MTPPQKLGRDWIGIDVTQLAISLIKNRLQDTYGRRLRFVTGAHASGVPRSASSPSASSTPSPSGATPDGAGGTPALPEHNFLVRIIGEPTTPNEAPANSDCPPGRRT